jgi:hypothetical protein
MKIIISLLLLLPVYCGAQQSYVLAYKQYDSTISEKNGNPKDSLTFYFPELDFKHSEFELKWFSFELFKLQEKVLYNNYLGRDIYRFTWLRSMQSPVVIKVIKYSDSAFIITKELNQDVDLPSLPKEKKKKSIHFKVNERRALRNDEFQALTDLVDSVKLLSTPSFRYELGMDGSEWIVEIHTKDGYYYATRWEPKEDAIISFGTFMIDHSDLNRKKKKKKK